MSNVLERIVADKRVELEARMAAMPLATFKDSLTPVSYTHLTLPTNREV